MVEHAKSKIVRKVLSWSGIPESNWRLLLGRESYCHCTNPANVVEVDIRGLEGSHNGHYTTARKMMFSQMHKLYVMDYTRGQPAVAI